ncbi:simple sugar transport system ATP-binding protein [Pararhizobium capsulatum DSM 1112]|uniref:Simple sugar transport system ATP-binding protein n=1 Tax=Pararhizobium capsulatum DSM 1112 TaxID=1121113 RepID=A0ABU0BUE5_9HYPH|nr:ABC transporter ATP-binding protein [Pararhizobium capsulatum]MDQ0321080.1 simple sugar transport system ATP-binding protein [Pararhizobium capsulatum DSM 1112]
MSSSAAAPSEYRLELRGIRKAYPSVIANDGVELRVAPGEIHAVVGENGAGKSTLMKIIYGMVRPDAGDMLWNGREVEIASPADAQRLGIGMVFQHFALFDTLTVAENIALAMPDKPRLDALSRDISAMAERYGLPIDPRRHIYTMSVGERQRVEIVRALLQHPQLLILDEPTSVLTPQAVETLFVTLRQIAADGCSILYISHKLNEIQALCHSATILRGGKVTGVCDPRQESPASMARLMTGNDLAAVRQRRQMKGQPVRLEVEKLDLPTDDPFGTTLRDINLSVRGGEILGIAGVSGNGQAELLAALSGEATLSQRQTIRIDGRPVGHLDPLRRRALGLCSVPEDRLHQGSVPSLPLSENVLLTANRKGAVEKGMISFRGVTAFAERCIKAFDVRCSGPQAQAGSLSGGNLQKFIIGREILQEPGVLVVSQPTWGVDVGAAIVIRQALLDLRDRGAAIVVISEELDELFEIADRIAVIAGGRLTEAVSREAANRDAIGIAMAGGELKVEEGTTQEMAHAL